MNLDLSAFRDNLLLLNQWSETIIWQLIIYSVKKRVNIFPQIK